MIERGLIVSSPTESSSSSTSGTDSAHVPERDDAHRNVVITAPLPQLITKPLHQLRLQMPTVLQLAPNATTNTITTNTTCTTTANQYQQQQQRHHKQYHETRSIVQTTPVSTLSIPRTDQFRTTPNSVTVVVIKTMLPE